MGVFIYEKIAQQLKDKITANVWRENERLPSIRYLSEHYGTSKVTIQSALHKLEASGLIKAKAKSGYYVVKQATDNKPVTLKQRIEQPALVNVPDIFHEIMHRSAAFDIRPSAVSEASSSHLQLLNRHITRAIRQHSVRNSLYYGDPNGLMALREQVSAHYRERNLFIDPDDICITSGCQNSLYLALSTVCQAGDTVAIESPAFYGVLQLLQFLKLRVIEIPTSITQGVTAKNLASVLSKWKIKACVLTPNFSTPTGACIPQAEKKAIYQLSIDHQFTLIEDDIYGDLGFHFTTEPLKALDTAGNIILCSSVSKSLSRDLRVGWIIGGKQQAKINHNKLVNQLSNNQAIQQGVANFMAEGEYRRHLHYYRQVLLTQRDQLLTAINQWWQFPYHYTVPDGGLSIWLSLDERVDTIALYNKALERQVVLTPGALFSTSKDYNHCLRLSFVHAIDKERLLAIKQVNKLIGQF